MQRNEENNDLYFVDVPQVNDNELSENDQNESFSGRLPAPPAPVEEPTNTEIPLEENTNSVFPELEDIPMANQSKKKKQNNRGPKLDSNLLLSSRGFPALKSMTQQLKFKGPGHEYKDLNLLMSKLEHWAHRLYPKYTFGDTLEQLEVLGNKASVKSAMQRMRMGLPLLTGDGKSSVTEDQDDVGEDSEIEYDESEPQTSSAPNFLQVYGSSVASEDN